MRLSLIALILLTLFTACKQENTCEGWPSGFACYEIINGDKKEYCTTPLLKGWNLISRSNSAEYALELTIQQGYHHLYVSGERKGFFKSGMEYDLNAYNEGNYYPNVFGIAVDQQWFNSSSGLYWYATSGHLTITDADSVAGKISLYAEYTLQSGSDTNDMRSYIVEMENCTVNFNPR